MNHLLDNLTYVDLCKKDCLESPFTPIRQVNPKSEYNHYHYQVFDYQGNDQIPCYKF
jgi:penicillin V acylase-like amidase (Ntn superfamily)